VVGLVSAVISIVAFVQQSLHHPQPARSDRVQSTVTVPTSYGLGQAEIERARAGLKAIEVSSPTTFKGDTTIAPGEQLWAFLKPPKDPASASNADRLGLYKVTSKEPIKPARSGEWSTVADIGNGACDIHKEYELRIIRVKPLGVKGAVTKIDELKRQRSYPELRSVDRANFRTLGIVRLRLASYDGDHTKCAESKNEVG
jgi:hypothetical protein